MTFKTIRKLCTPALVYLFVEVIILFSIVFQNLKYPSDILCIGDYQCSVESKSVLIISKLIYIAFWTFILNLMCKGGYTTFAWFLVLLPLLLFFVIVGLYMLYNGGPNKNNKQQTRDMSCKSCEGFDNESNDPTETNEEEDNEEEMYNK